MRRPLAALFVAMCLGLAGCAAPTEISQTTGVEFGADQRDLSALEVGPSAVPAPPLGSFVRWRAMEHVRKLADDIGSRVRARGGELRGAQYIAERFRDLGYNVRIQRFDVDGGTSRNVVAWWPDSLRYPVILGGHMDTVPGAPGANDNASGVAVLLETARLVAGHPKARYVRFVAFGSEEYGTDGRHHVGSQVFVNRLGPRGRNRLAGAISVDMVAAGRPLLVGTSGIGPAVVARALFRKIDNAGIAVDYRTLCDCSDNGPFEHAGIPASFMWSGPQPCCYHSPDDTVPNMEPNDLERSGRALRAFVGQLTRSMIDRFRQR
ncbi:MAG: M20/M25/M40 family metallo-hydrolase [Actinomycetota bacterium]|nr:M20/M25/M40 family metallo-hydrolase [Actinomycetota bacterium]